MKINKISKSLKYNRNFLCVDHVDIRKITERFKTPFYCYSLNEIKDNFETFKNSLQNFSPLICYAVKANFNKNILSLLGQLGCGADVVSKGELKLALDSGIKPGKIVFSGVGKTKEEIVYAIKKNIFQINVESSEEVFEINAIAKKYKKIINVSIRVNPDVDAKTHQKISTGRSEDKFGISAVKVVDLFKRKNDYANIKINGLAIHIGSQITELKPFSEAFKKIKQLIEKLQCLGIQIKNLDLGGGIGINYFKNDTINLKQYNKIIKKCFGTMKLKFIFEPGRCIVGSAGFLVSRVIRVKKGLSKSFLILDAGMNDLMRPSLYDSYHHIIPLKKNRKRKTHYDIVGPICESSDVFGKNRILNELSSDDYVIICSVGAYGSCMSSNYNCRKPTKEIIINNSDFFIS